MTSEATFGDLNGPLLYWGPAVPAQARPTLTTAEQAVLLRLRARLENAGSGTVNIAEALDTLLESPQLAGSAA